MKKGLIIALILTSLILISGINGCSSGKEDALIKCSKIDESLARDAQSIESSYNLSKEKCYIDSAINFEDISICKNVDSLKPTYNTLYPKDCYKEFVKIKQDTSFCDKAAEVSDKDNCYDAISDTRSDVKFCDNIINQTKKDFCYWSGVGILKDPSKDPSICDEMQDKINRDYCYHQLAQVRNDSKICDNVLDSETRVSCYETYNSEFGVVR